jgi:hypothetical protein
MTSTAVRACLVATGLAALAWCVLLLPTFWEQRGLIAFASALERGESFATPVLLGKLNQARAMPSSGRCNAALASAELRIRVKALEDPVAAVLAESLREETRASARQLLRCAPLESFAWLVLAWLEGEEGAVPSRRFDYLRQSYRTSPNEAAVGLWRDRFALAQFRALPDDLVARSLDEFARLVETERLYPETVELFAQATPDAQLMLAARIGDIAPRPKQVFARALSERGIRAAIPGIEPNLGRPWSN